MRHFREKPTAESGNVTRTGDTGQQIVDDETKAQPEVDDNFYAQRERLSALAQDERVDFNGLSPTGKQAALSLQQESKVRLVERDRRTVVERSHPNRILQVLSAGLLS